MRQRGSTAAIIIILVSVFLLVLLIQNKTWYFAKAGGGRDISVEIDRIVKSGFESDSKRVKDDEDVKIYFRKSKEVNFVNLWIDECERWKQDGECDFDKGEILVQSDQLPPGEGVYSIVWNKDHPKHKLGKYRLGIHPYYCDLKNTNICTGGPVRSRFFTISDFSYKPIYSYPEYGADANQEINSLHINTVIFVPLGITTSVKPEWYTNADKINNKIKQFFEKQFKDHINITFKVVEEPIYGDKQIEDYSPHTLAQEAKAKTLDIADNNRFNIWMVYLVRDEEYKRNVQGDMLGGLASIQSATQYEYWLDDEAWGNTSQYGLKGSAHEFAHALGIPHPWELPANVNHEPDFGNVPEDLMVYVNNQVNFDDLYIREDVKQKMGL